MPNQNEKEQPTITELARNFLNSKADLVQDVSELSKSLKGTSSKEKKAFLERLKGTAVPAEKKETTADYVQPQKPLQPEIQEDSALVNFGNSLRARRMKRNGESVAEATVVPQPNNETAPSVVDTVVAPQAEGTPEEKADAGLAKAMPEIEGDGGVVHGDVEIGPDGNIVNNNTVTVAEFEEGGLPKTPAEVATEIMHKENNVTNANRAKALIKDAKIETPASGAITTAMEPDTTDKKVVFHNGEGKPASVVEDKVIEHEKDGTTDADRPDELSVALPGGLAKPNEPKVDEAEVKAITPGVLQGNTDKLVQNGQIEEVLPNETSTVEKKAEIIEPHPVVAEQKQAEVSAPPASPLSNEAEVLDKLIAEKAPLEGQAEEVSGEVEIESPAPVLQEEALGQVAIPEAPQAQAPELVPPDPITTEAPKESAEVKAPVAAEGQIEPSSTPTEVVSPVPEMGSTDQNFWAANAAKAEASTPKQNETTKASKKFWGWLLGKKDAHPAEKIAYTNHQGLTAEQVHQHINPVANSAEAEQQEKAA